MYRILTLESGFLFNIIKMKYVNSNLSQYQKKANCSNIFNLSAYKKYCNVNNENE